MIRRNLSIVLLGILVIILSACSPAQPAAESETNMANPASVYCEENGGKVEIREDESGGQIGFCVFPDGSECDEWAYSRGECKPGDSLAPSVPEPSSEDSQTNMANPASTYCVDNGGTVEIREDESGGQIGFCVFPDGSECEEWAYSRGECKPSESDAPPAAKEGWQLYEDAALGYSFQYPAEAVVQPDDNPLDSISIVGPLVDNEHWPFITISHPQDREDFQVPQDAELLPWLVEHNLMGDTQVEDAQIAGTTAVHLRHERSEQSYAYDRYYFAHSGQLYMIVIGHTGDKEDWELYNYFLESFTFEP